MKSLIITVLMFLTLSVGTKAQENQKVFTAEEQAIIELSNDKWNFFISSEIMVNPTAFIVSPFPLSSPIFASSKTSNYK